ncbi:MAG: NAD-dependent epimerase/dehydratase family protein, partial [Phycisphaerae bacterium]
YNDDDAATPTYRPLNMYGYSKHMFDLWALQSGALRQIVGLKYFNVYGPREDYKGDMRSVIHKAHGQIRQTGTVQLFKSYKPGYADGEQKRDFIYIQDVVDVTLHFLEQRSLAGLYNCGTGQARTWKDLVTAVFVAMGKKPNIEFIDMPPGLREKYQYFTEAQTAKLRSQGQYQKAFTTLEAGITDYVKNYLALAK